MAALMSRRARARVVATFVLAAIAGGLTPSVNANGRHGDDHDHKGNDFRIETLSTRPDLVSGGDVLVRIDVPRSVSLNKARVELNGRNVTGAFRKDTNARTLTGLVTGLKRGRNVLEASAGGRGGPSDRLTLTNHPITGPIFSGPHQQPFICETEVFGLGPALDSNCSAPTKVDYVYMSTQTANFLPLDVAGPRPADLAQTTTDQGNTVDFTVRVETGTINRAVYQIAFLHAPGTALPRPFARTPGWNGKLVYTFGGGARASYHQGRWITGGSSGVPGAGVFTEPGIGGVGRALADGYAMASSTFNVNNIAGNDVISGETAMMVKERFIEQYGAPNYTIGYGRSGGAMQQHLIAHNYPGILDGLLPGLSFPDTWTFLVTYLDCALVDDAFNTATTPFTPEQKLAVIGHRNYAHCSGNFPNWRTRIDASNGCDPAIPAALIFNAQTNPGGARCTFQDNQMNLLGVDPATGFARRPLDNVGVQYGRRAFDAGLITFAQFAELNRKVGGFDINGAIVPGRMEASRKTLRTAYRTGRLNSGAGLDAFPIIDAREYLDGRGDVHDLSRSLIMRARLVAANGHADNQVIWTQAPTGTTDLYYRALRLMDQWVADIKSDTRRGSAAAKVKRNKPDGAVDACFTEAGQMLTDRAACQALYPPNANTRLAAGEPLTQDILKCKLKPVSRFDYSPLLEPDQLRVLRQVFPDGVCDYDRRGVGQVSAQPWLTYPRR